MSADEEPPAEQPTSEESRPEPPAGPTRDAGAASVASGGSGAPEASNGPVRDGDGVDFQQGDEDKGASGSIDDEPTAPGPKDERSIDFGRFEENQRSRSGSWRTVRVQKAPARERDALAIAWDMRDRGTRIAYVLGRRACIDEAPEQRLAHRAASALASSDLVVIKNHDGTALDELPSIDELLAWLNAARRATADPTVYLARVRDVRFRLYTEDEFRRLSYALAGRDARIVVDVVLDSVDVHAQVRRREAVYAAPWGDAWLDHMCELTRLKRHSLDRELEDRFLESSDWRETAHAREAAIHRACLDAERALEKADDLAGILQQALNAPSRLLQANEEQLEIIDAVMSWRDPGRHCGPIGAVTLIVAAFAETASAPDFDELCNCLIPDGDAHPAALPPGLAQRYEVARADAERLERETPRPPSWRDVHAAAADDVRAALALVVGEDGCVRPGPTWSPEFLRQRLRSRHAGRLDQVLATIGGSGLLTEIGGTLFGAVRALLVAVGEAAGTRYEEHLARALKPAWGRVPVAVLAKLYPGIPVEHLLELVKLRDWVDFAAQAGGDPHAHELRAVLQKIAPDLRGETLHAQRVRITDKTLVWTARVLAELQNGDQRVGRSPALSAAIFSAMERTDGLDVSIETELYAGLLSAFLCVAESGLPQDAAARMRRLVGSRRSPETAQRDRMQTLRVMEKWLVEGLLENRELPPNDALPMTNWLALTENPNGRVEASVAGWVRDEMIARATSWPNGKEGTPWLIRLLSDQRAPNETEAVAETATVAFLDWLATPPDVLSADLAAFLTWARPTPDAAMQHKIARMAWRLGSIRETLIGGLSELAAAELSKNAIVQIGLAVDEQLCAALSLLDGRRLEQLARSLVDPGLGGELRQRPLALFGLVRTAALAQVRLRGFAEIVSGGTPERARLESLIDRIRKRGEPVVSEHVRGLRHLADAAHRAARTASGHGAKQSAKVYEARADRLRTFAQALARGPSAVPAITS